MQSQREKIEERISNYIEIACTMYRHGVDQVHCDQAVKTAVNVAIHELTGPMYIFDVKDQKVFHIRTIVLEDKLGGRLMRLYGTNVEITDSELNEIFPVQRCQHSHDCCGHWYRSGWKRNGSYVEEYLFENV